MKKLLVVLAVLASSLVFGQQTILQLEHNISIFWSFKGESGNQMYSEIKSINDFNTEYFSEIKYQSGQNREIDLPGSGRGKNILSVYTDSIKCHNPDADTTVVGWNVHEFSEKDGIIRFQSTKYFLHENKLYPITVYTLIDTHALNKHEYFLIEYFKVVDKTVSGRYIFGDDIIKFNYNNI